MSIQRRITYLGYPFQLFVDLNTIGAQAPVSNRFSIQTTRKLPMSWTARFMIDKVDTPIGTVESDSFGWTLEVGNWSECIFSIDSEYREQFQMCYEEILTSLKANRLMGDEKPDKQSSSLVQNSTKHIRGPNPDTIERIKELKKYRRDTIRETGKAPPWTKSCELIGRTPRVVIRWDPLLREYWNNPDY